jgi:proteasome assembly chaperone (PAC2) family protein
VDVAQRCQVSDVVVLGSYWDRVSHIGRALLTARTADPALREKLQALGLPESRYQGPTGFTSALLDACAQAGLSAAGLSGRAPHYVQGITHPKLAHGLLQAVAQLLNVRVDIQELESAGREQERLLTERVQEEPKLWQYIQQLAADTGQTPAVDDFASGTWQTLTANPPEPSGPSGSIGTPNRVSPGRADLPSGEDLVDAVEKFLRSSGRN